MTGTNLLQPTKPEAFLQRFTNLPVLSVKRKQWRMEHSEHERNDADPLFKQNRKRAFERDGYRCWFCGFASTAHQEAHHLDGDHTNNHIDNLATVCNIDHLCFHLGYAATSGSIFLAAIPELTQPEITNMMRIYHCLMTSGNEEVQGRLKGLYAIFESRSIDIFKRVFEADFSKAHEIAIGISKLDDAPFAVRNRTLEGLRVIPTQNAFKEGQLSDFLTRTHSQYFDMSQWPVLLDSLRNQPLAET